MFCPNCGREISVDKAKFCHSCGFDFSKLQKKEASELYRFIDSAIHPQRATDPEQQVSTQSYSSESACDEKESSLTVADPPDASTVSSNSPPSDASLTDSIPRRIPGLRETSYDNPSWWSRFKDRWGMGWAVLGWLFYSPQASKGYEALGSLGLALQLVGCASALVLYFFIRRRLFRTSDKYWLVSPIAGLIAYGTVWTVLFLIGQEVATGRKANAGYALSTDSYNTESDFVSTRVNALKAYISQFVQKDKELWARYSPNPKSNRALRTNIEVLDEAIPLYRGKDSVVVDTYESLGHYFEASSNAKSQSSLARDCRELADRSRLLLKANQSAFVNLRHYYVSLLDEDGMQGGYWKRYVTSQAEAENFADQMKPYLKRLANSGYEQN